ncbi:hypothetical protein L1887_36334 [Cichorium endivia]|nr:hypothetical protein L1887_36334 [Cichorium endivia]
MNIYVIGLCCKHYLELQFSEFGAQRAATLLDLGWQQDRSMILEEVSHIAFHRTGCRLKRSRYDSSHPDIIISQELRMHYVRESSVRRTTLVPLSRELNLKVVIEVVLTQCPQESRKCVEMITPNTNEVDLETVMVDLLKAVVSEITRTAKFRTLLKRLEKTLSDIEPIFYRYERLRKVLYRPDTETKMFMYYVASGKEIVLECSKIKCWNVYKKFVHANKLIGLDNMLLRFFQSELQDNISTSKRSLAEIYALGDKLDEVLASVTKQAGGFSDSCSVPGLPDVIIGLDVHLQELKRMLLKDDNQVLTVSAPGGCGKTTLTKMLCHDDEIKGIYGDNIFYVTVSRTTSLKTIVQKLFAHFSVKCCGLQTDEEAKNQLENFLRQMRSKNILLALDDVWSESESLVQDLKFTILGYKILVTSRFLFLGLGSTYELTLLNDQDAKTLFCSYAFHNNNCINVADDLVNKMVKYCKGFPLALTVIGASLCGQNVVKWRTTFKKWSEGQSIFQSNSRLLLSLQASFEALEDLPILKECFLDLGSFPEDEKIAASAFVDMWIELYNLDEEGMYTTEYLLELSSRNLLNLLLTRKDASELEGYCNEHYVTQHDLLRELAIHLSSLEQISQRNRLFIEIYNNQIPTCLIQQMQQPIAARLLSITTDESFSSIWYDLNAPKVEVLVLNIRSQKYALPSFIQKMNKLKVLNITSYGTCPSDLHKLHLIKSLSNLKRIRLEHLSISHSIQSILELYNLKKLSFIMCEIGNALSTCTNVKLPNLLELEIDRCYDLTDIPSGFCSLNRLKKLSITNCHELDALPSELGSLLNLEILRVHSCTRLVGLPESIGYLSNLVYLDISDCLSISTLPYQIGELYGLRVIKMSGCRGLEELPDSVMNLCLLEDVICDEETSYLWSYYENDLYDLKINTVEDDRFANFMKIIAQ